MNAVQQRTLQIAKRYLGANENQGTNRGTIIAKFQLFIGKWMLGQPWCAAFATFCVWHAEDELKLPHTFLSSASSSAIYAWAKKSGRLLAHPVDGCVGLVKAGPHATKGKSHEHTFLVHTVKGNRVVTVEGNWKNRVMWFNRPISDDYDYVRIG